MHSDVIVVGAGAAGIAAAVAAAKVGATVVLVERHGLTGGLATSALVGTICGLFYRHPTQARYAVQGFAREFAEAVHVKSNTKITKYGEGLHFLPYQPAAFHQEAIRQLRQAGVRLLLGGFITAVQTEDRKITELRIQTQHQVLNVYPSAVVDCSGTSQISMLAGIDRITEAHYQAGAFVFQVGGLPEMEPKALALNLIRWLKRGVESGDLTVDCERLSIIPGSLIDGMAYLKLGLPVPFNGAMDTITQYELEARERSITIVNYLHRVDPFMANVKIIAMANEVGIRTGERLLGLSILDEAHVMTCAKPDDGVAVGAWPIEYWGVERKPEMRYFAQDECYWIAANMLVSKILDNLFSAGRIVSATEMAIASARVIGTCLGTGYAAGSLAAELCNSGIWQNAINKIRSQQILAGID